MIVSTKSLFKIWKDVFSKARYIIITISIALFFYLINVLIQSWRNVVNFYSILGFSDSLKFFANHALGFYNTVETRTIVTLLIISVLLGILVSLIVYKSSFVMKKDKKIGFIGGIGVFLGVFVPGCAACGVGLVSVLGFGAVVITYLPFNGVEIALTSIVLLLGVILYTTKNMYYCKIKIPKNKGGKKYGKK